MEVLMNRFIGGMVIAALALGFGLGTIGCQGGGTDPGSPEKGKEAAKKAAEGMRNLKKGNVPAGGAGEETKEKAKDKDKGDDKE
jgi:hypothetical protein